jgi:hypothetical protein
MPLIDGNVTRCDIRVPNDLYEQIESLAISRGAKIHHRSNKPEVTGTILELIKIGLTYQHLSPKSSDNLSILSGSLSDEVLEDIASKVYDKLSNLRSDNLGDVSDLADKISDIETRLSGYLTENELRLAIAPFEKKLEEFDKGFQGLGSVVHDHDRMLSEPVASKEDLNKAIASLKTEIEDLRNTFNSYITDSVDEVKDVDDDDDEDDSSSQGITKASLEPIFNDGVSVAVLTQRLNLTRQSIEERRNKGTLDEIGYTAKKEGSRWKYYSINEI